LRFFLSDLIPEKEQMYLYTMKMLQKKGTGQKLGKKKKGLGEGWEEELMEIEKIKATIGTKELMMYLYFFQT